MIKNCDKNNIQNISKLIFNAIDDIAISLTGEQKRKKFLKL